MVNVLFIGTFRLTYTLDGAVGAVTPAPVFTLPAASTLAVNLFVNDTTQVSYAPIGVGATSEVITFTATFKLIGKNAYVGLAFGAVPGTLTSADLFVEEIPSYD